MGAPAAMIANDLTASQNVLQDLRALTDFNSLGPDLAALCASVLATVGEADFPGALAPDLDATGELSVFLAAPDASTWRRLAPVMRAFAGVTLTSFDGMPQDLPVQSRVGQVLRLTGASTTGVARLSADPKLRAAALRAMTRACETLSRAPPLQRRAPEPTSWMLARFQDCLNVGRRDAAQEVLTRLAAEMRLDALNLKFLEVQLLAAFGEWKGITELAGFSSLCIARRTPAVTALLLEALYQTHLAATFEAGDEARTRDLYIEVVRPFAHPMLVAPAPATLQVGGRRLFGLETWISPARADLANVARHGAIGWLAERLPQASVAAAPGPASTVVDQARQALTDADGADGVDALAAAAAAFAKLTDADRARLREAEPFKSILRGLGREVETEVPRSWLEWLEKCGDPDFTNAFDIARHGKDEWPVDASMADPVVVIALVAALNKTFDDPIAAERTGQALPFIVGWMRRDVEFPRAGAAALCEALLTLFTLNNARGKVAYESSQVLINALLSTQLTPKAYASLIADVEELAGEGFGVSMVYWLLELIEDFIAAPTPDAAARDTFLHSALSRLTPLFGRLSGLQRAAAMQLAAELGWTLDGATSHGQGEDSFAERLSGLRIAIYSLSENASRQAKTVIEATSPTTTVDLSADHGGSVRLKALAEGADLFVIAWLSAKHAATDYIREHRGDRPIAYAQGKGFSSLVRAVEDHLAR